MLNPIFHMHLVAIALENQTFVWNHNRVSFCICWNIIRTTKRCLNVYICYRVFKFFWLFETSNTKMETTLYNLLEWCSEKKQLFNIVKFWSKPCGIAIGSTKLLLSEIVVVIIDFWVMSTIQQTCWWECSGRTHLSCVLGFLIYLFEKPQLSNDVFQGLTSRSNA